MPHFIKCLLLLAALSVATTLFAGDTLLPGDIAIVYMRTDDADKFSFVTLRPIAAGTVINFTDKGWKSNNTFRADESTLTWTSPAYLLPAGTIVKVDGTSAAPGATSGGLTGLSNSGDQIFAFQGSTGAPAFIYGLNNNGSGWQSDGGTENDSAQPPYLVNGLTCLALAEKDNAIYAGTTTGTKADLLAAISNKANWSTSDSNQYAHPSGSFAIDEVLSGVVGDPTNPGLVFAVSSSSVTCSATSYGASVVPSGNLSISGAGTTTRTLYVNPVGVGYAWILISMSDGTELWVWYGASAAGGASSRFHTGAADASAAIAVDANYMIVADDEDQKFRLYHRNNSGAPIKSFDMSAALALTEKDGDTGAYREVDVEGAARVANRIYWIGSHSNSSSGSLRDNRNRIFATDLSGSGSAASLAFVGMYKHLRTDLLNWDKNNLHGKGANYFGLNASAASGKIPESTDKAGFNIEGLCMKPGSSTIAYVGFRAPCTPGSSRTKALIVPVNNFTTLAVSNAAAGSATFGAAIELDLGGRGIRSMESGAGGVILVAGPCASATGVAPNDFRIFTWTGNAADAAQLRAANLAGMNPEALVEFPAAGISDTAQIQLLSDNGDADWYNDGTAAKLLTEVPHKKFRSDRFVLGAVVAGVASRGVGAPMTAEESEEAAAAADAPAVTPPAPPRDDAF